MATSTQSLSAFSNEELRKIFKPALQRLRTILNNHQHLPQDEDWPHKVRRAVMGLVKICNKIPSTCPLYAGHPIKALFDQIRAKPGLLHPGTPLDLSFLKDVKPDESLYLDPFDEHHPHAYIDQTLDFIAQWQIPPLSSDPPAHQSGMANDKGTSTGKGKEKENEGGGTADREANGEAGDEEEEEDEEDEDEDKEVHNRSPMAIRRSPRKRATTSGAPGGGSGSGTRAAFVLCDRCLKAKALAEHSKALGKKFDQSNLDPPCTPPGSGSCPRCANGKKKCERLLNGDAIKALAVALKRGRQRKSAVAPDDPALQPPQSNQEVSTVKKSSKRKSAAYIEDSDVDSNSPAAAADSENTPAAKKPRMDHAQSVPASEHDSSKAGVKAKPIAKRMGKGSKATTPLDPLYVSAMPPGPSTVDAQIVYAGTKELGPLYHPTNAQPMVFSKPLSIAPPIVYAGTKELGPLYHPTNAQPMVFSKPLSIAPPTDSTVIPAYHTELPTGNIVADLVNCTSKQDAFEGRINQAESRVRGLTAAVNRLEETTRTPTVRRGEFDELHRKIAFLEKDFNEREARLEKTTDSALALVRTWEERMKAYEARMEGIEERMVELTNKVDSAANNSVNQRVSDLDRKVEHAVTTCSKASREAENLQQEVKRDLKGLYVVEGNVRELLGRMADAERQLEALGERCQGLQGDSDEIWDRLTTSVNQSTLEAVLDRLGGAPRCSDSRTLVDRGTSPAGEIPAAAPPQVVSRATSPLPAPLQTNFTDRATSPIPDQTLHPTRLNITDAAPIDRPASTFSAPPSASVAAATALRSPPAPLFIPPDSAGSEGPSPAPDDVAPDSPLSPPPDDPEDLVVGARRKATKVQVNPEGAAAIGTRRSKRPKKS